MEIAEDLKILLKKVCSELRKNNLQFCLAGGWAVSMTGLARTTMDIDILIVLDENIKRKVVSILENSFNLIQSHEKEMELKNITIWRNIVSLKGKNEPYMLDLLKADNDYLKTVIERRIEIDYESTIIPVISIEDLIVIKLASFRKQDQVDIENLIQSGGAIDWGYLENTIKKSNLAWSFIEQIK
jgi:predicted nucleotidyltransferase